MPRRNECRTFFEEVVLKFEGDECLPWPYVRVPAGYGQLWRNGRMQHVHRLVCEEIHGPPPSAKHCAAHTCGNGRGACVNPRHLRWATPTENQADRIKHGTDLRGAKNHNTKLTEKDVRAIMASLESGKLARDIAPEYGVTREAVNSIRFGRSWAWVTE
jgi:hypothetical protein